MDNANGPSSLVASLSTTVELLEGWIDTVATNGVRWGTQSMLVATLLHFLELKSELELLRSKRNTDLTPDQADALWTWVCATLDSLVSHILPAIACSPPDGMGE
jgi:hypothetical protein